MATAHLCGPPVPRLLGLNYRPCGEASTVVSLVLDEKAKAPGVSVAPQGHSQEVAGLEHKPRLRCSHPAVVDAQGKLQTGTQRRVCLQTAGSRQLRGQETAGRDWL